jgi:hypothetical protein
VYRSREEINVKRKSDDDCGPKTNASPSHQELNENGPPFADVALALANHRQAPESEVDAEHAASEEADIAIALGVPATFHVDDEAKASWVVRKIVEVRAYATRVEQWAEQELRRAERDELWLMRRFGSELEQWLRAELQRRGGRSRSVPLPAGTIGLRRQPPKLELTDELAVVVWAERNFPDCVRVTVEAEGAAARDLAGWQRQHEQDARMRRQVLREPLNRYFSENGELPEGAQLSGGEDRLYVK